MWWRLSEEGRPAPDHCVRIADNSGINSEFCEFSAVLAAAVVDLLSNFKGVVQIGCLAEQRNLFGRTAELGGREQQIMAPEQQTTWWFINKIKHDRRIATRYEKTARNFLSMLSLAAAVIWLREYG